ncbi:protein LPA2 [Prosopis cineraria]|uniref:protein LPA2 n=1 Tax=Prosopis cineraria TaxID=364024 RepID=UPI00240FC06F|nr:protein LPA2 [Prosopis cineraria]
MLEMSYSIQGHAKICVGIHGRFCKYRKPSGLCVIIRNTQLVLLPATRAQIFRIQQTIPNMALQIHFFSSFTNRTCHLHHTHLFFSPSQSSFSVRSQKPSESSNPTTNFDDSDSVSTTPQKSSSPGVGFVSSLSSNLSKNNASVSTSKKKQKGKTERASIIRRSPVEKPAFVSEIDEAKAKELRKNESAFLLAWLGFGAVILVEGLFIAASGFLPEELDKFCVNYLYPSFTPTVFVFVAGTVVYGVYKYLQNENIKGQE